MWLYVSDNVPATSVQKIGTNSLPYSQLSAARAFGDTVALRGLQGWQIIRPEWNKLYFEENDVSGNVECVATISGTPRFFRTGSEFATALKDAMNSATCGGDRTNNYTVVYNPGADNPGPPLIPGGAFWITRSGFVTKPFRIGWTSSGFFGGDRTNNITGALGMLYEPDTDFGDGHATKNVPQLLYNTHAIRGTRDKVNGVDTYYFDMFANRIWNGEVITVTKEDWTDGDAGPVQGFICGMTFPTAAEKTNPPSFKVQAVAAGCGAPIAGDVATFTFAGGEWKNYDKGADFYCGGFRSKTDMTPCDLVSPPSPLQFTMTAPYIDLASPIDPVTKFPKGLFEAMDGTWRVEAYVVQPSAKGKGATPLANSLIDIKGLPETDGARCLANPGPPPAGGWDRNDVGGTWGQCARRGFAKLWYDGQAGSTALAGPWPWQLTPIKDHKDPKERTIVVFVTDGDDTCPMRGSRATNPDDWGSTYDTRALRAAYHAERLYTPLDPAEPASSVETYVIGFGGAFEAGGATRLNWISWGGSGLGQGPDDQPNVLTDGTNCEDAPGTAALTSLGATGNCRWKYQGTLADTHSWLTGLRAQCKTCRDAFIAPSGEELESYIESIIDQGVNQGEFIAGHSVTETVFEYADRAGIGYAADDPETRFKGIVPTRFVSSFTMPGFKGQLKAYQSDSTGTTAIERWSAGEKLLNLVNFGAPNATACLSGNDAGMCLCAADTTLGREDGECRFSDLTGTLQDTNASAETAALDSARIKRRIYTTSGNGVYHPSTGFANLAQDLVSSVATNRVRLWPPENTTPLIVPASWSTQGRFDVAFGLPSDGVASPAQQFAQLQKDFGACKGTNPPAACTDADSLTAMKAARREAREIGLAYLAGAVPVMEAGQGFKRTSDGSSSLLYKARSWVLADSVASAAVQTYPVAAMPKDYQTPYTAYLEGMVLTKADAGPTASHLAQAQAGFGLRSPDAKLASADAKCRSWPSSR